MKTVILTFLAFTLFCYSSIYAEGNSGLVFKIVCETNSSICEKAVDIKTQEELFVEKKAVLSSKDIEKVEVVMQRIPSGVPDASLIDKEEYSFDSRLSIIFTEEGRDKLKDVTTQNVRKRMAVFFNGELIMSPEIREPITGGKLQIVSNFNEEEARNIAEEVNKLIQSR